MNKAEMIALVAAKHDMSKAAAGRVIQTFLDATVACLRKGERVTLVGFGTFRLNKRAARAGVNPRTNEKIKIKSSKTAKFVPAAGLKKALN